MSYDNEPLKTLAEKAHYLGHATAEDWILFLEHDPVRAAIRIEKTDLGFAEREEVTL